MLALSLYALSALSVEVLVPLESETRRLLQAADTGVCILFLLDFVHQFIRAPSKWQYFSRWGWIDLLSSIPMIDVLRIGRLARVMRILRVLRGVRSTKLLVTFILERRAESAVLAIALAAVLLVLFASIAMLQFEGTQESANIRTAGDALWWAMATITTVGYGDRFPTTSEGRVVAGILMIAGVGLFGTLSGLIASSFLTPGDQQQEGQLQLLRTEVADLRRILEDGRGHPKPGEPGLE
ncbi:MAG: ion transporter [Gemmatimonadales bacterium]|nr:ion transporter [Gemmatimonadales bacterium]